MMDGGGWGMWGFGWWMMLIPLLFLALFVWLIIRLADLPRAQAAPTPSAPYPASAGVPSYPPPAGPAPAGRPPTTSTSRQPFRVCPYCGEALDLPAAPRFCPHCAAALTLE